jgi:hypothetical protein
MTFIAPSGIVRGTAFSHRGTGGIDQFEQAGPLQVAADHGGDLRVTGKLGDDHWNPLCAMAPYLDGQLGKCGKAPVAD